MALKHSTPQIQSEKERRWITNLEKNTTNIDWYEVFNSDHYSVNILRNPIRHVYKEPEPGEKHRKDWLIYVFYSDHYSVNIPRNPVRHVYEKDEKADFGWVYSSRLRFLIVGWLSLRIRLWLSAPKVLIILERNRVHFCQEQHLWIAGAVFREIVAECGRSSQKHGHVHV